MRMHVILVQFLKDMLYFRTMFKAKCRRFSEFNLKKKCNLDKVKRYYYRSSALTVHKCLGIHRFKISNNLDHWHSEVPAPAGITSNLLGTMKNINIVHELAMSRMRKLSIAPSPLTLRGLQRPLCTSGSTATKGLSR